MRGKRLATAGRSPEEKLRLRVIPVLGQLQPVATLVYRRAKHLISLTAVPADDAFAIGGSYSINGYNIVRWTENGVTYWAVSDVEAKELETFAQLFRTSRNEL